MSLKSTLSSTCTLASAISSLHLELAPLAPHRVIVGLVVLRVEERDTPEVVGVVVEDRRTVRRDAAARVEVRRDRVDRGAQHQVLRDPQSEGRLSGNRPDAD